MVHGEMNKPTISHGFLVNGQKTRKPPFPARLYYKAGNGISGNRKADQITGRFLIASNKGHRFMGVRR